MEFDQDDSKIHLGHMLIAAAVILRASGKQTRARENFRRRTRPSDVAAMMNNPAIKLLSWEKP